MLNLNGRKLILASASPRRANLLKLLGLDFEIIDSHLNENEESYTMPEVHVLELAQKKALKVADKIGEGVIVGADTIVVLNKKILGKPKNVREAKIMLAELSGKTHSVYTGIAFVEKPSGNSFSDYEKTEVTFRELQQNEIDEYVKTGSPLDKAGAYGIQDLSAVFVTKVDGCFYNVVGFPITKFYNAMRDFLK